MAETMIGIKPINRRILVGIYDDGDTTMMLGGKLFYLLDDSSATKERDIHVKHQGVRDRWAIVLATPGADYESDLTPGDKVLLEQLTWSRGMNAYFNGDRKKPRKVWSIPDDNVLGRIDGVPFTDAERKQIAVLYPDWEKWETRTV